MIANNTLSEPCVCMLAMSAFTYENTGRNAIKKSRSPSVSSTFLQGIDIEYTHRQPIVCATRFKPNIMDTTMYLREILYVVGGLRVLTFRVHRMIFLDDVCSTNRNVAPSSQMPRVSVPAFAFCVFQRQQRQISINLGFVVGRYQ